MPGDAIPSNGQSDLVQHYDAVRSYLHRKVFCSQTADDLTQTTYVRALRAYDARAPPRNPYGWLRQIARNVTRDYFNRRKRLRDIDNLGQREVPADGGPDAIDRLIAGEDASLLREAVAGLPEETRSLVEGYYFQEKACRRLGLENGIRYENVKIRLHRARKRLGKDLGEDVSL